MCPLCKCVLEKTTDVENLYPDVRIITRKMHLLIRIYAFVAIVAETLLLYFNYRTVDGLHWSIVAGVVLFYAYIALNLTFMTTLEYKTKAIILIMTAIFSIILIDVLTGFHGWSLNYFLPGSIILLNSGILVAMFINIRNWQSYMMIELMTIVWSAVPFIFLKIGLMTHVSVSLIALAYSVFLFLGTIIIGGKRASTELKRRFHVR